MAWVMHGLIAMAGLSAMTVLMRVAMNKGAAPQVVITYIFGLAFICLAIYNTFTVKDFWTKMLLEKDISLFLAIIFASVCSAGANQFGSFSISLAPNPGYSMALISSQTVLIMIMSVYVLKDSGGDVSLWKWIGAFVVVVGVSIIALSK